MSYITFYYYLVPSKLLIDQGGNEMIGGKRNISPSSYLFKRFPNSGDKR